MIDEIDEQVQAPKHRLRSKQHCEDCPASGLEGGLENEDSPGSYHLARGWCSGSRIKESFLCVGCFAKCKPSQKQHL